jgi:hypothetical protein
MQHTVKVAAKMLPLTFFLTPSASITGHVTLSTGDEAEGLQFMLYRKTVIEGHSRWMQTGSATAGSDGVFRLIPLDAPASYVLCSVPFPDENGPTPRATTVTGYRGGCYPGGVELASAIAAPITLSPGQQADVEISLARQWFYPVSITLPDENLNTYPQVFDHGGRPMQAFMRQIGDHAGYEINLPNGSYFAEARVWGKQQLYGRVDFAVSGAPVSGVTIIPAPVQSIAVEIHKEFTAVPDTGSGMAIVRSLGASDLSASNDPGISLSLVPADKPFDGPMGTSLRPTGDSPGSGQFEMDPPSPGTYRVEVEGFGTYASSIISGGTDLLREPLTIVAGKSTAPIEITLRNDTGRLACTARATSAQPAAAASGEIDAAPVFVYVIPVSWNIRKIYRTVAGVANSPFSRGQFALPLPPGAYLVVASMRDIEIDLDNPDEMSRITAEAQTVNIQPGTTTEVQVDPIDGSSQEANQ